VRAGNEFPGLNAQARAKPLTLALSPLRGARGPGAITIARFDE